jgi:hypothetical protein
MYGWQECAMLSQYPNPERLPDFDFLGRRISFSCSPCLKITRDCGERWLQLCQTWQWMK